MSVRVFSLVLLITATAGLTIVAQQQPLPPELLGSGGFNLAGNDDMSGPPEGGHYVRSVRL